MDYGYNVAFPAYAGMNRQPLRPTRPASRVPRVCGDEPGIEDNGMAVQARSPRMRG